MSPLLSFTTGALANGLSRSSSPFEPGLSERSCSVIDISEPHEVDGDGDGSDDDGGEHVRRAGCRFSRRIC
jgi:hypothetical protein